MFILGSTARTVYGLLIQQSNQKKVAQFRQFLIHTPHVNSVACSKKLLRTDATADGNGHVMVVVTVSECKA